MTDRYFRLELNRGEMRPVLDLVCKLLSLDGLIIIYVLYLLSHRYV
jgi:hypothetical protein